MDAIARRHDMVYSVTDDPSVLAQADQKMLDEMREYENLKRTQPNNERGVMDLLEAEAIKSAILAQKVNNLV
jgi:hypothetical protein